MPETEWAAVVLAAGASTRLGQAKQLIEISGESLLRRTARLALESGCRPVVVVLGFEAERMRLELAGLNARVIVNSKWHEGMSGSLRCGLETVESQEPPLGNILLLVCDQPRLTIQHLRTLLARHAAGCWAVTASSYAGRMGVPAIFSAETLPELVQCTGDQGARDIIRRDPARVQAIEWPDGALDVDRPEDLEELAGS